MKSSILALSRRRALLNGTAAVIAGATGLASGSAWSLATADASPEATTLTNRSAREQAVEQLATAFRGPEPAAILGRASLDSGHIPVDPDALFEAMLARHPDVRDVLASADPAVLRQSVGAAVRRDFADGHSLVVRGWLLARTEAEIASLICLA